jgi:hypothetical protein
MKVITLSNKVGTDDSVLFDVSSLAPRSSRGAHAVVQDVKMLRRGCNEYGQVLMTVLSGRCRDSDRVRSEADSSGLIPVFDTEPGASSVDPCQE